MTRAYHSRPQRVDMEYLGDGVYAWFDGYQIWVETDRDSYVAMVALEGETLGNLIRFAKLWI